MFVGMSGKFIWGMSGKIFLVTSPPRQQFWGKILMLSLPVRANYTVPPSNKMTPIRPWRTKIVLDIQTVHHILKNTAVQNVNKPFVYITDLTSTLRLSKKLSKFSMMFYRETSQLQPTPTPKRTYDVSRGQNRYVRLPLTGLYEQHAH
jgi:hypothetical protein